MDTIAIDYDKMNLLQKYGQYGMRPLFKKLYNTVINERKICVSGLNVQIWKNIYCLKLTIKFYFRSNGRWQSMQAK